MTIKYKFPMEEYGNSFLFSITPYRNKEKHLFLQENTKSPSDKIITAASHTQLITSNACLAYGLQSFSFSDDNVELLSLPEYDKKNMEFASKVLLLGGFDGFVDPVSLVLAYVYQHFSYGLEMYLNLRYKTEEGFVEYSAKIEDIDKDEIIRIDVARESHSIYLTEKEIVRINPDIKEVTEFENDDTLLCIYKTHTKMKNEPEESVSADIKKLSDTLIRLSNLQADEDKDKDSLKSIMSNTSNRLN